MSIYNSCAAYITLKRVIIYGDKLNVGKKKKKTFIYLIVAECLHLSTFGYL